MKKNIIMPELAQKIQDDLFRKMTAEQKLKKTSQLFVFLKKLQKLNDRKNGDGRPFNKSGNNIR